MRLNELELKSDVARALEEDIGTGDITASLLDPNCEVIAEIITREPMLVCGIPWVNETFRAVDGRIKLDWLVKEAAWLPEPTILCRMHGPALTIMTAERSALNFLQTLSGTATTTYRYVEEIREYSTVLLDTRKTIPGLRWAQKYAVSCAGAMNHRFGLYDAFLIKENHIKAQGSIQLAILNARQKSQVMADNPLVEVEVQTLEELTQALIAKPDRILLDNFSIELLQKAVRMNQAHGVKLEASGGIDLSNIKAVASTGVDFISIGALTKSIQAIDLSLLVKDVQ
jgi:nicotinate-nucleotide pyrophosphorylase (carboxylating)